MARDGSVQYIAMSDGVEPSIPAPATLDYAPPLKSGRWRRRLVRWSLALLGLVAVGIIIAKREWILARWQLHRLEHACMTAELPTERPVCEQGGGPDGAAEMLAREHPGEYVYKSRPDIAARAGPRWTALSSRFRITGTYWNDATVFLHERRTPSGRRRLVVLVYSPRWADRVYVIEPASG